MLFRLLGYVMFVPMCSERNALLPHCLIALFFFIRVVRVIRMLKRLYHVCPHVSA
jgi:hypothetical protein